MPPTIALMPVGSSAAASAIARPRTPTSRSASSVEKTPASARDASSPTEWPATPNDEVSTRLESCSQAMRLAATMSGCAIWVSRIVSASDRVPCSSRSTPDASEKAATRSATPSSSSQGERNPGVCEPWPGLTTTITVSSCQASRAVIHRKVTKKIVIICRMHASLLRHACRSRRRREVRDDVRARSTRSTRARGRTAR